MKKELFLSCALLWLKQDIALHPEKKLSYRVVFIGILVLIGTLMDIFLYLFCGKKEL